MAVSTDCLLTSVLGFDFTSDADTNWIMAVHVECLRGPEHQNGEEVGSTDEGDHQSQAKHSWILLQTLREHGILCNLVSKREEQSNCTPRTLAP